jgi:hypothetical protein
MSSCTYTQTPNKWYLPAPLIPTNTQIRAPIPLDREILVPLLILNHQALLVGKMEHANEAIGCRNICHGLLGIHRLQAVDHVCEGEGAVDGLGSWVLRWGGGRRGCCDLVDVLVR